ncbi:fasciclin domain-containing protein [Flavobacterium sp.]|uniref:fasciclin domain-containing protein n=1 Tax=Flavobacterium sp. TaxID=239 RepID=UPI002FD94EF0
MKSNQTKKVSFSRAVLLFCLSSFVFVSCENNETIEDTSSSKFTLVETLEKINEQQVQRSPAPGNTPIAGIAVNAQFNELVNALVFVDTELNAGLVPLFSSNGNQFTVFAPTDEAFQNLYNALGVSGIEELPAELVLDVLKYHVVEGRRAANSVVPPVKDRTITTLLGATFTVNRQAAITAVGNTAQITAPNISASNGIIHVIDAVLLPIVPGSTDRSALAPGTQSIAALAVGANFTELVSALAYVDQELNAGLIPLFANGRDQYTVFAPTNEAFQNLYTALGVSNITEIPAPLVLRVLQYHVVEGRRLSNSVVPKNKPRTITTLLGSSFSVTNQGVIQALSNTGAITTADISASNGVIHVIDTVLLPTLN